MSNINKTKLNTDKRIAESFYNICISAYEYWQMYKIMYKYKIDDETGIWGRFGTILHQYWVLQIAKINDPGKYRKDDNFSLAYFVTYVGKDSYKNSYNKFLKDNEEFIEANKKARDKVISHCDFGLFNSQHGAGAFPTGRDEYYFKSLLEIISEGYKELGLDLPPEWPSFIVNDTKIFMDKISKVFDTQQSS